MILEKEFFQAPNAVFDNLDLGLNRYDRMVYLYLCRCSNHGADAFPGYGGIARKCGISRATARRAVKSLESKGFITVTRRHKSNQDNDSNLYQVNPLPCVTQTPRLAHRHQPSATETPPLVKQGNQSSTQVIHYKEPIKKNHSINNQSKKNTYTIIEDTNSTTSIENDSLRDKDSSGSGSLRPTPSPSLRGAKSGKGTNQRKISEYLSAYGKSNVKSISQGTGIPEIGVRNCLSQNKELFYSVSRGTYALTDCAPF